MKISVCIDAVFSGHDFLKSIEDVKRTGINAFEFWGWWDKDIYEIKMAKDELDMEVSAFCTKSFNLVEPSKRMEYVNNLKESIKVARELNCKNLITQVGNELKNTSREEQHKSIVQGLKLCAPILEGNGITLLVEPLNTLVDHMGYYLYSSNEAFKMVDEVGSPNVKVLYDIYHQQIMEGHLISKITKNIDKIGHFHAAGNPGRHELTTGEINYKNIFKAIDDTGFSGYMALEYFPVEDPVKGLKELDKWVR